MTDHWDTMIEMDDAELVAEIKADIISYATHTLSSDRNAQLVIERKYGMVGLSPEGVALQLAEMALDMPIGGA